MEKPIEESIEKTVSEGEERVPFVPYEEHKDDSLHPYDIAFLDDLVESCVELKRQYPSDSEEAAAIRKLSAAVQGVRAVFSKNAPAPDEPNPDDSTPDEPASD